MVKLDLEKAEKTEIKLTTSVWSSKKEQNSRKASTPASLTTLKPLTVWFTTNRGKFLKWWEYQATLPAFWETCVQVKKQQLEPDIEYVNAVYCHPAYLTYMQSTSWKILGWMKHKLESRLPGEISITSGMQMISSLWQKEKKNCRASWWKWKRRVKKLA